MKSDLMNERCLALRIIYNYCVSSPCTVEAYAPSPLRGSSDQYSGVGRQVPDRYVNTHASEISGWW